MKHGTRISGEEYGKAAYWADGIADYLIKKYPNRKKFVCASGISPSGPIHFGNFREVITTFAVVKALQNKGKRAEFIYSWDDFDRFRKVPADIDPVYEEHIGKALSNIPSPHEKNKSYAEYYQQEFEKGLEAFNIKPIYKYQTKLYQEGTYDEHLFDALRKRKEIADILLSFMTEKGKKNKGIVDSEYRESYFPISLYSRFTSKDATEILSYDGKQTVRYRCKITKKEEAVNLAETRIAKLNWKVDWAMRWKYEEVCFEPGGSDHAAPGGSYDVSATIAKKIFNIEPPVFTEYGFVGIQGGSTKMSGSKGVAITPNTLLAIYEPALLLWMYLRRLPSQTFSLAFDTEVYRQYDEMDSVFTKQQKNFFIKLFQRNTKENNTEEQIVKAVKDICARSAYKNPISFRNLTGLAQIAQWDKSKLQMILKASQLFFDTQSIQSRLPKARAWLTEYNREAVITVRKEPNTTHWKAVDNENRGHIKNLYTYLQENPKATVHNLEEHLYSLPKKEHTDEKELKKAQRSFFKHLYQLLITQNSGPRLSTFLWALPKETTLHLLIEPK
ncbi:MAG: lysine--tRNA ligase [Candidatus Kaiserbacteria bacterium]|nr:lysine--tRNA ligase [Candidatus Kaiserbacteria bacterium]